MDAVNDLRGVCPSYHSHRLYVPSPCAFKVFNFPEGGARRSPRCTYPLMLPLDGNTLAGGLLTFLWLSARPRVLRVWPGPLPGPLWIRLAREEGEVGGRDRVWRRPFFCCRRVAGVPEAWPPPGGLYEEVVGFSVVFDTTGCGG